MPTRDSIRAVAPWESAIGGFLVRLVVGRMGHPVRDGSLWFLARPIIGLGVESKSSSTRKIPKAPGTHSSLRVTPDLAQSQMDILALFSFFVACHFSGGLILSQVLG